ncbi:MAG: GDP-mannose 4,6-dehydratase, partial [Nitrospirae bacterium]|nr:GDP-mannose 4,6-dehydratase [Nitrospirota bacterium]
EALRHPEFHFVEGDIRDGACLDRVFSRFSPRAVFHAAARAGVRPSIQEPLLYEEVNIRGTMNLLEKARDHSVENFVFASSSSVYGENRKVPFSEADNVDFPISPYAATKKAGELLCYTAHHLYGIPITCLRFFTVYGPRQRPEMAIHKFVRLIDRGMPIPVYGDGSSRRDYTYIDDIVEGVTAALEHRHPYEIVNLGESRTTALAELIAVIEESLGKKAVIERHPVQPGDVPITYADVDKAKRILGYKPATEIREGIQRFVDWYRREAS